MHQSDRVAKALTTLGRVIKTIYILRYIHEEVVTGNVRHGGILASPSPCQNLH
ncbi:MAG: Tn3 family transposase [Deltaproteobacteria bacterium]|nr:Tn3 family transposase [Deltaproteobacteria bacterium]